MRIRIVLLIAILTSLSGCYVLREATHLLRYQSRAERFESLLQSEDTSAETRDFLRLVDDVRRFGETELGLGASRNYTTYVPIDQDYLVSVVSATEATSFTRKTWWFPIVGSVPYKGFYGQDSAVRLARKLEGNGYDVLVRKVDAFSTLGFFRDPVFSFMENYSVFEVASLILHEQTHATIFLKNRVQFNEELASFVGTEGALLYLDQRYGPASAVREETAAILGDQETFLRILRALYADLKDLYGQGLSPPEILSRKEQIIAEHQRRFALGYDDSFDSEAYRGFGEAKINNAYLNLYMTYTEDLDVFYDLYQRNNHDLRATIEELKELEGFRGDPKEHIRKEVMARR